MIGCKGHFRREPNVILLEIAKHAIDIENERKKNIENRAGVALGLFAATSVFFLQEIRTAVIEDKQLLSNYTLNIPLANFTEYEWVAIIDICLWLCIITCAVVSVHKFLCVFGTYQEYKSLRLDEIIDIALEDDDEALFALDASGVYMEQLECNSSLNDDKANSYELALLFFKYTFWCVCARYMINIWFCM